MSKYSIVDAREEVIPLSEAESAQADCKITQFTHAMQKYNTKAHYKRFNLFVSVMVLSLQGITVLNLCQGILNSDEFSRSSAMMTFMFSYVATDFINGLIHMYMDNNTEYTSLVGPFVAAFHMHHRYQKYTSKHSIKIYFHESGAKIWLPFYLCLVLFLQLYFALPFNLNLALVLIGILSSFAEVSHYWCHNSGGVVIRFLQKRGVLLSMEHHKHHHKYDNKNYAFLNGMTDPLLNVIAAKLYSGYKGNADVHARAYVGAHTSNRH